MISCRAFQMLTNHFQRLFSQHLFFQQVLQLFQQVSLLLPPELFSFQPATALQLQPQLFSLRPLPAVLLWDFQNGLTVAYCKNTDDYCSDANSPQTLCKTSGVRIFMSLA